jgi:hypothetical protein
VFILDRLPLLNFPLARPKRASPSSPARCSSSTGAPGVPNTRCRRVGNMSPSVNEAVQLGRHRRARPPGYRTATKSSRLCYSRPASAPSSPVLSAETTSATYVFIARPRASLDYVRRRRPARAAASRHVRFSSSPTPEHGQHYQPDHLRHCRAARAAASPMLVLHQCPRHHLEQHVSLVSKRLDKPIDSCTICRAHSFLPQECTTRATSSVRLHSPPL